MNYFTPTGPLIAGAIIGVLIFTIIFTATAKVTGWLIRSAINLIAGRRRRSAAAQEEPRS